ncbi:hypothetical protein O0L34_g8837 [Tuta absoluta]|nr:hypothetical protein O0L34_g8837 [Tuta absoluta]
MIAERRMLRSFVICLLLLAADAQDSNGPVIVSPPNSEITLMYQQNYTLLCHGKNPVRFVMQELLEESLENTFRTENRSGISNGGLGYWAALDLISVDRCAVRYYACIDDTIDETRILQNIVEEPQNSEHVSYIYVYVNGSRQSYAPYRSFVVAKSDSKFIVECKPTTPDTKVSLLYSNTVICSSDSDPTDFEHDGYSYSSKVGFTIDSDEIPDFTSTIFTCSFDKHGETLQYNVEVHKIFVSPMNSSIEPTIIGGDKYFLDGEAFTLNCTVEYYNPSSLSWLYPETADLNKITTVTNSEQVLASRDVLYRHITVYAATAREAGTYECIFGNSHSQKSTTFTKEHLDSPILNLLPRKAVTERYIKNSSGLIAVITFTVIKIYPKANVTIYKDDIIINHHAKEKYKIDWKITSFAFTIKNLTAEDTAVYTFEFFNGKTIKINHTLNVIGVPRVNFNDVTRTYMEEQQASLQCEALGFPLPVVEWYFTDENNDTTAIEKSNIANIQTEKYKVISKLTSPVKNSGNITCKATNKEGTDKSRAEFLVYDAKNGFEVEDADKMWYAEGENVTLKCLASKYEFQNVTWIDEDFNEIPNVHQQRGKFSLIAIVKMDSISVAQAGNYTCLGIRLNDTSEVFQVSVTVARTQAPKVMGPSTESITVDEYKGVNISCFADAVPAPTIVWYKDSDLLEFDDKIKLLVEHPNLTTVISTVEIGFMQVDYAGTYECRVKSRDNLQIKSFELAVNDQTTQRNLVIYLSSFAGILTVMILLVIYLVWKVRRERRLRKELAAAGLLYFKEGVTKSINPDLGIDEQAELLPYDEAFEFPAEKLTLGKQLGAGAFGVVYKAEARGIINAEETTTVAVKMVKKTAEDMYIKALASELKIMVHLGKHINIVNLLGACTKNVGKRELIVIVEYCKYGNIHNYLQKHRQVFIDQLNDNPEKDKGKVNRGYSCSSGNSVTSSDYFGSNHTQHTDNTFLNTANTSRSGRKVSESSYVQPEWRSNYESDYSFDGRSPRPLCSRDLLAWSFQIARGMEYLASRKILHGDLAARNILLAEDNVIKICDFGLARSIYKNDEYQKKENSPLPVKWLAIECMTDRIFTTQSDVWSFGIVLWEIFSLAKTPYPNISPPGLLHWLSEGHRLEKPAYADERLYDVMRSCWLEKPTTRPSFTYLQEILGSFLEDNVRNHYVDLNATYMDMNAKHAGEEDYLAMVAAPDYNNQVTPSPHQYVNQQNSFFPPTPMQLQHDDEGYLQMSPASKAALFTPRVQGTKFDFDARKLSPRVSEPNSYGSTESTPMLTLNNMPRSGSESDQEGNASPYMNMCPKIVEEPEDDVFGTKENNAKNMQPLSVTNPTYITLSIDDEKKTHKLPNNYMNVQNGLVK